MNKTKIEWCDSTWNPVTGCLHGCEYCYAKKQVKRFEGWVYTPGSVRVNASEDKTYIHPMKDYYGEAKMTQYGKIAEIEDPFLKEDGSKAPYPFGFLPTFHRYRLDEPQKQKKPRTIFVCSMADLFGEWIPFKWIDDVIDACRKAPQHRYLFLTKNPKRYAELDGGRNMRLPPKNNMWYGATTTNNKQLSEAIKSFGRLSSKARTFLSVEPILEDISQSESWRTATYYRYVDWVIIGAETGNRKDKVVPSKEWIENIVYDCACNDIPVFMKDSLIPIIGEEMRREFPWEASK